MLSFLTFLSEIPVGSMHVGTLPWGSLRLQIFCPHRAADQYFQIQMEPETWLNNLVWAFPDALLEHLSE